MTPEAPDSARQALPAAPPAWLGIAPVLFLLFWSMGFVAVKLGLRHADPLSFLSVRYVCVIVLLLPVLLWLRPALPRSPMAWLHLAIVGLLMQAGYLSGTYLSMSFGMSAGAVALITAQQPILMGLLAPLIAREHVDRLRWLGLALGVSGAVLVIGANSTIAFTLPGLLFALLSLFSMTGGTLWEKRFGTPTHPVVSSMVQSAASLAVAAPLALTLEAGHLDGSPAFFAALAYLVIANSIIAISLLVTMIRYGEASRVSAFFFLIPPATALIAYFLLGETMAPWAWPGVALAGLGIYLVMREPRSAPRIR